MASCFTVLIFMRSQVWDTATNFSCQRTLTAHRGIVHALCVHKYVVEYGVCFPTHLLCTCQSPPIQRVVRLHHHCTHPSCLEQKNVLLTALQVWDMDSYGQIATLEGHDNPVCTLAIANSILFSGSLKSIKVLFEYSVHRHVSDFLPRLTAAVGHSHA